MPKNLIFFHPFHPAAAVRITGEDAFEFLQGQFTNDLRLPAAGAAYGLWLNQKGKVLADSEILRISEKDFWVFSASSAASVIIQRLEQYIIADDVVLDDQTSRTAALTLWGEGSAAFIQESIGEAPAKNRFVEARALRVFNQRKADGLGFELWGSPDAVQALRTAILERGGVDVSDQAAEVSRIEAGIPSIPRDIGPSDLPQEAGLETTAISFTKGCYLGQEVMARLKSMGQVRRRLQRIRGTGPAPLQGAALFQNAKKVGEVRSAVATADGFVAMAMLTRMGLDENEGLSVDAADEAKSTISLWTK